MDICSCFTDLLFILEPLEPQAIPWMPFKWCFPPFCLYIYIYIYRRLPCCWFSCLSVFLSSCSSVSSSSPSHNHLWCMWMDIFVFCLAANYACEIHVSFMVSASQCCCCTCTVKNLILLIVNLVKESILTVKSVASLLSYCTFSNNDYTQVIVVPVAVNILFSHCHDVCRCMSLIHC